MPVRPRRSLILAVLALGVASTAGVAAMYRAEPTVSLHTPESTGPDTLYLRPGHTPTVVEPSGEVVIVTSPPTTAPPMAPTTTPPTVPILTPPTTHPPTTSTTRPPATTTSTTSVPSTTSTTSTSVAEALEGGGA